MAYQAEKMLRDNADKVPADLKTEIEGKISDVRNALNGTDIDAIKNSSQQLSDSLQKLGSAVYEQAGAASGGAEEAGGAASGTDDGTVEGEFREV